MKVAKIRGKVAERIAKDDALPETVASILSGIIDGLRESTKNPPKDDKGCRVWQQDKVSSDFADELEGLKFKYGCKSAWRNRAGLPRD